MAIHTKSVTTKALSPFPLIGREKEIRSLEDLLLKKRSSLVVIKGRRRVGKSRLIEEFCKGKPCYVFSGLPPTKRTSAQTQRNEFARQLSTQTTLPPVKADDWGDLFFLLSEKTKRGRAVICFDEISWMGSKDPAFLGKLKNAWDLYFKKNNKLILILCGSVSTWIEKNILQSTGFFGRISLNITLSELSLPACNQLLESVGFKRSPLEKLTTLSVTGGIPWYIELLNIQYSAAENIKKLCFEPNGILTNEYQFIFHDLFGKRANICKKIIACLAQGPAEYQEIVSALHYHKGGPLSDYLNDLVISQFISRDFVWSFKTGKEVQISRFRLRDNYLRFYLKYIEPRVQKIQKGQYSELSLYALPGFENIIGLQFENLVLNNRLLIFDALGLRAEEVVMDNPYFQHATQKLKGCQIDYLIQNNQKTLFACEIKFSKNDVGPSIIAEVKEKISKIALPRGFSCLPVLIHIGSVNEAVIDADYFFKIIDFSALLEGIE